MIRKTMKMTKATEMTGIFSFRNSILENSSWLTRKIDRYNNNRSTSGKMNSFPLRLNRPINWVTKKYPKDEATMVSVDRSRSEIFKVTKKSKKETNKAPAPTPINKSENKAGKVFSKKLSRMKPMIKRGMQMKSDRLTYRGFIRNRQMPAVMK
jgi:hypothetical protein